MRKYAEGTNVDNSKSRYEIEWLLGKYGATKFAYASDLGMAMVAFQLNGRYYKLWVPMPDRNAEEFRYTDVRRFEQTKEEADKLYAGECNRRWRCLKLLIQGKLEAVDLGITTIEDEFLAATVTPSDETVGEYMQPHLEAAYSGGKQLPAMPWNCLPAPKGSKG